MEGVLDALCRILLGTGETCPMSASTLTTCGDVPQLNTDASAQDQKAPEQECQSLPSTSCVSSEHGNVDVRSAENFIQGVSDNESHISLTDCRSTDVLPTSDVCSTDKLIVNEGTGVCQDEVLIKNDDGQSPALHNAESVVISGPPLSDMPLTVPVCPPRYLKVTFNREQTYVVSDVSRSTCRRFVRVKVVSNGQLHQ
jgi:hypothetical protein